MSQCPKNIPVFPLTIQHLKTTRALVLAVSAFLFHFWVLLLLFIVIVALGLGFFSLVFSFLSRMTLPDAVLWIQL